MIGSMSCPGFLFHIFLKCPALVLAVTIGGAGYEYLQVDYLLNFGAQAIESSAKESRNAEKSPLERCKISIEEIRQADLLDESKILPSKEFYSQQRTEYTLHKQIVSTLFWIGEEANSDNRYIPNKMSTWDVKWTEHYGGIDNPKMRNGFNPAGFTPKENPFYCALPYNDFENGKRKDWIFNLVRWIHEKKWQENESICKNRWVRIIKGNKIAYAQWEDSGPFGENDINYVFGNEKPKNPIKNKSGIDISPAVASYLNLQEIDQIDWQFVDENDVPDGPWKKIITKSDILWKRN